MRAAIGAESAAHGELFAAGSEARQEKIGQIDAGNQENGADGAPESDERAAESASYVVFERRRNQGAFVAAEGLRKFGIEIDIGRDAFRIAESLRNGHIGFEAADESDDVPPHALLVEIERSEENQCERREKTPRQNRSWPAEHRRR